MTHAEAVAFWYGRINYEVHAAAPADLKLERMRALLRLLGDPHRRLRVVHVTGTKGKGSTCALVGAALGAAGYRVGLFTSPHLERVEERFQVDGVPITAGELAAIMADIAPAVARLDRLTQFPPITFFEISTAVAFLHFVRRRAEVVLLEVGLGGRFDSTNVCFPLVTVVTSVGLDHVAQLGGTLEAIAFQKGGILKPRVPAVSGVTEPGPAAVIAEIARHNAAPLVRLGVDITAEKQADGTVRFTTTRPYPALRVGLLGDHQVQNAAVALLTIERLRAAGFHVPDAAIGRGFAEVVWPGRVEVLRREPTAVIVDSAHNVPSAEALTRTLAAAFPQVGRKRCIVAISSDKDVPGILTVLAAYFDEFVLTTYTQSTRSVPAEQLGELLAAVSPGTPLTVESDPCAASTQALAATRPGDLLCIAGSVFLAGELRGVLIRQLAGVR